MSDHPLYPEIEKVLREYMSEAVPESTRARLVGGSIGSAGRQKRESGQYRQSGG